MQVLGQSSAGVLITSAPKLRPPRTVTRTRGARRRTVGTRRSQGKTEKSLYGKTERPDEAGQRGRLGSVEVEKCLYFLVTSFILRQNGAPAGSSSQSKKSIYKETESSTLMVSGGRASFP